MCLCVIDGAGGENRGVTDWAWLTPLVSFVVGLTGGAILLWNNRQRPHDVLKTYVDIYNNLPDGDTKDRLWSEIAERLRVLTTAPKPARPDEVPIRSEFRPPLVGIRLWGSVAVLLAVAVISVGIAYSLNAPQIIVVIGAIVVTWTVIVAASEAVYGYIKK